MTLTAGSMCTGYGGLELGLAAAGWPVRTAWHAELDPDASAVLAHRWPGVPNLGDIRGTDWASVEPVDVLTAGFPCQPVSLAGRRAGTDDERWLWDDIATAVGRMDPQPRMLLLENVPGLLTANRGNAMARVVHGLAALGYVGRYRVLRAADVGAPHARARAFIVAELADAPRLRFERPASGASGARPGSAVGRDADDGLSLLPTPGARLGDGRGAPDADLAARRMDEQGRRNLDDAVALLPTPMAADGGWGRGSTSGFGLRNAVRDLLPTPAARDADRGAGWGDQPGRPLSETIHRLLPTPTASRYGNNQSPSAGAAVRPSLDSLAKLLPTPTRVDASRGRRLAPDVATATHHPGTSLVDAITTTDRWGQYADAIARWEQVLNRPAPDPTEPGRTGAPRLSPRFVEWMHGLPDGWVTAVPGLSRNAMLRLLGNGVVPLQAAAATTDLTSTAMEAA